MRVLLLILILGSTAVLGQSKYNLPPKNFYKKATLGYPDSTRKKINTVNILSDSLNFLENEFRSIHVNNFTYLEVPVGSKGKLGAAIGAGTFLALSVGSIIKVKNDPNTMLADNIGTTVTIVTFTGAVLGGIIGATIKKKRRYYFRKN